MRGVAELSPELPEESAVTGLLLLDSRNAEVVRCHQSESVDIDRKFDLEIWQAEHRRPERK